MCKYCEEGFVLTEAELLDTHIIGWKPDMLATELFGGEYYLSVFIDRGYIRLVDKDDCQCLDHGDKEKINYCPMCGRKL